MAHNERKGLLPHPKPTPVDTRQKVKSAAEGAVLQIVETEDGRCVVPADYDLWRDGESQLYFAHCPSDGWTSPACIKHTHAAGLACDRAWL